MVRKTSSLAPSHNPERRLIEPAILSGFFLLHKICRATGCGRSPSGITKTTHGYAELSYEAVAALRKRGFKSLRLEDGLPEWRAAGLTVVTGNA